MVSLYEQYEQSQTMTAAQCPSSIPFDHTEISLADIEDDSPVVCETYVENAAEVVEVLPAKTSRTVLVPVSSCRSARRASLRER